MPQSVGEVVSSEDALGEGEIGTTDKIVSFQVFMRTLRSFSGVSNKNKHSLSIQSNYINNVSYDKFASSLSHSPILQLFLP